MLLSKEPPAIRCYAFAADSLRLTPCCRYHMCHCRHYAKDTPRCYRAADTPRRHFDYFLPITPLLRCRRCFHAFAERRRLFTLRATASIRLMLLLLRYDISPILLIRCRADAAAIFIDMILPPLFRLMRMRLRRLPPCRLLRCRDAA